MKIERRICPLSKMISQGYRINQNIKVKIQGVDYVMILITHTLKLICNKQSN